MVRGCAGPSGRRGAAVRAPRTSRVVRTEPLAVLGRRFAAGEIDEEEYWRRLSVLEEHFAADPKRGTA
ncbi:SHOCT domain-containing protein [Streptomyces platensis]|uniref:SHOCT domain-containing protein n=1 Tax=Streptomyces platensis TaxID=58346 RepID=UPI0039B7388C